MFANIEADVFLDDQMVRGLYVQYCRDLFTASSLRPYLPFDYLYGIASRSPVLMDSFLAAGATLEFHMSDMAKSIGTRCCKNVFKSVTERIDSLGVEDIIAILLMLDSNAISQVYQLLILAFQNAQLDQLPEPSLDREVHIWNCIRINVFWLVKVSDVHISAVLNQQPAVLFEAPHMPLPIPASTFKKPELGYYNGMEFNNVFDLESPKVAIPFGQNIQATFMILLIIDAKIGTLRSKKYGDADYIATEQAIMYSLNQWKEKFARGFPLVKSITGAWSSCCICHIFIRT
ncbi:hypothetical protein EDD86DRAFT_244542 [Gorgonomyces haynaldii]|nr:hypothetical protein EDD86DRAFT_244542 [Gorgonomyces haynaldii]